MPEGFPERLRKLRERRQMSRQALSELCGKSKNMVALYESGEVDPPGSVVKLLAENLGVTTDYLLGVDEKNF